MKLFVAKAVMCLAGVVLFAGCMSFDYVGQSFAPRTESSPVSVFKGRDTLPPDRYRIIGRGVLSGPNSVDEYDRMAELRSAARKHGADAVCIVGTQVKAAGLYPRVSGTFAPPLAASENVDNLSTQNNAWETDSFGQVRVLKGEEKERYTFETKVLFLKKSVDFDREMKSRPSFL